MHDSTYYTDDNLKIFL